MSYYILYSPETRLLKQPPGCDVIRLQKIYTEYPTWLTVLQDLITRYPLDTYKIEKQEDNSIIVSAYGIHISYYLKKIELNEPIPELSELENLPLTLTVRDIHCADWSVTDLLGLEENDTVWVFTQQKHPIALSILKMHESHNPITNQDEYTLDLDIKGETYGECGLSYGQIPLDNQVYLSKKEIMLTMSWKHFISHE